MMLLIDSSCDNFNVIIPTINGGKYLAGAVSSCVDGGILEKDIVVIDNGSCDDSVLNVKLLYPDVSIVSFPCNKGFAGAVNRGLECCSKEFILILNNDAELCSATLPALRDCFNAFPKAAIVGARLLSPSGALQNVVASFPSVWRELAPGLTKLIGSSTKKEGKMSGVTEAIQVPTVIGAAMTVRRSSLEVLGVLDEDFFFYLEETEWCHRAWGKGFAVVFCPKAEVVHALGKTANRFRAESRIEFHRSRLLYAKKVEGVAAYGFLLVFLPLRTAVNLLSNGLLFLLSIGFAKRQRTATYGKLLLWHLLGMPASWGLPNKCRKPGKVS